ncbi:hypothetical protein Tco_0411855 [Tanacetum coccineum]
MTGTFLLNNRYASILFDTGADRSFVSTTFSSQIDITPTSLDHYYDVELIDGRIIRLNTILRGCTLNIHSLAPGKAMLTLDAFSRRNESQPLRFEPLSHDYRLKSSQINFDAQLKHRNRAQQETKNVGGKLDRKFKDPGEGLDHMARIPQVKVFLSCLGSEKIKLKANSIVGTHPEYRNVEWTPSHRLLYELPKVVTEATTLIESLLNALETSLDMSPVNHPQTDSKTRGVFKLLRYVDVLVQSTFGKGFGWRSLNSLMIPGNSARYKLRRVEYISRKECKLLRRTTKSYAGDQKANRMEFQVGDNVMLKVSPWKGVIHFGKQGKLNPRYVGPFKVLEKVGSVSYKLELPQELSRVRNTLHVSNLKKCYADEPLAVLLDGLHFDDKLQFVEEPVEIMDHEV